MIGTVIQNILFSGIDGVDEKELYIRGDRRRLYTTMEGCVIEAGGVADFFTYFNSFSCGKWRKYTGLRRWALSLTFSGSIEVEFYHNRRCDGAVQRSKIGHFSAVHDARKEAVMVPDMLPVDGNVSFTVKARSGVTLYEGGYITEEEPVTDEVYPAIVFTTFRREEDIKGNVRRIESLLAKDVHIYVVDNDASLPIASSEYCSVITNRNLGGAGGFARGMLEVYKDAGKRGFTHCILMDDDISIDPRIIVRLMSFLRFVRGNWKEACVSGAMLRRDRPYIHVESGARRSGTIVKGFGRGLDMRKESDILINDDMNKPQYGGWWFYCIPINLIRPSNLPLPIFYQWDDVDYGVRNAVPVITMNGICVWHDAFEGKRSLSYTYYATRNPLIVDACHGYPSKWKAIANLDRFVINNILMYRYDYARMVIRSAKDFMKGPRWLMNLDAEAFHKKVMSTNRKPNKMRFVEEGYMAACAARKDKNLFRKILRFATLNGYLLPANRSAVLPADISTIATAYRADRITYYDPLSQTGYTCKRNRRKALRVLKEYLPVRMELFFRYNEIRNDYSAAYGIMTTEAYWEKVWEL